MNHNSGESINKSIGCTVIQCKYHDTSDYCTLKHIDVVTSDISSNSDSTEVTDCGSYVKR